jgi:predicted CoA-binding protein
MTFQNPSRTEIDAALSTARTIAVVGLSNNPARPSFGVAEVMSGYGYRIIPVSPTLGTWQGIPAVPSLDAAVESLAPGERIDIVDVFRQPQHVAAIVDDCLRLKLPTLWLQLGVVDEAAALRAQRGGIVVVMDKCIKVERMRMG